MDLKLRAAGVRVYFACIDAIRKCQWRHACSNKETTRTTANGSCIVSMASLITFAPVGARTNLRYCTLTSYAPWHPHLADRCSKFNILGLTVPCFRGLVPLNLYYEPVPGVSVRLSLIRSCSCPVLLIISCECVPAFVVRLSGMPCAR